MSKEQFLIQLFPYMKIPYLWGGKNPYVGLDCSGFVWNVLRDNQIQPKEPLNAAGLYEYYLPNSSCISKGGSTLGDLLFFGSASHIHHVAIALNDKLMIEAARGDETVTSLEIAQSKKAYVDVSPITRLNDLYAILRLNQLAL